MIVYFLSLSLLLNFQAHEDAIFGFSEAKSAKKNQDLGLMVMPKIFKENLPVPLHILRKELGMNIYHFYTSLLFIPKMTSSYL